MYLVNNPRHCKGRDRRRPFLTTEKGPKSCCVVDVAAIKTGLAELEPSILIISFPSIYLPGRSVGGSVGRKHGPQPTGQQRKVKPQKQVGRPPAWPPWAAGGGRRGTVLCTKNPGEVRERQFRC